MSYHVRKVKTGSEATAVQVVKYINRKRIVVKHFGSAHNKEQESIRWNNALRWISEQTKQIDFFEQGEQFISLEQFEYLGFQYTFLYETLYKLQSRLGYTNEVVIERYRQLYKIEQAFRISKHDLKTRPIFHFKEDPIRLHLLI